MSFSCERGEVVCGSTHVIRERGGAREFVAPQRPNFDLVIQVTHGSTWHEVDFTRYSLETGDVIWIHAGQVQQWGRIGDIEGRVVLVEPTAFDVPTLQLLGDLRAADRTIWPAVGSAGSAIDLAFAQLEQTALQLRDAVNSDAVARDAALVHAVLAVLFQLAGDNSVDRRPPGTRNDLVRAFREDLEQRFTHDRSVGSYARRLGSSERTLNRATRSYSGMSAKEYIDARVVLEAKRRLVHEATPVALIARDLGFDDPSNFSKYFIRRVGRSPRSFRHTTQTR